MTKFAVFDEQGLPTAFYSRDIHGRKIPSDAVEIADEQWLEFIENSSQRRWLDGQVVTFEPPRPATTIAQVKVECRRRILLVMTEDQQRNTLAAGQAAVMQYGADPSLWPEELQQRQAAAMLAWTEIERLRVQSNQIEMMDPIPADIVDDALWA